MIKHITIGTNITQNSIQCLTVACSIIPKKMHSPEHKSQLL